MEKKDKKQLSETDVCDLFITLSIKDAGWDPMLQIRQQEPSLPVAVVEAKGNKHTVKSPSRRQFVTLALLAAVFGYSRSSNVVDSNSRRREELIMLDGWVLKESDLSGLDANVY